MSFLKIFPTVKKARFTSFYTKPEADTEWKSTYEQKNPKQPPVPQLFLPELFNVEVDCTELLHRELMSHCLQSVLLRFRLTHLQLNFLGLPVLWSRCILQKSWEFQDISHQFTMYNTSEKLSI